MVLRDYQKLIAKILRSALGSQGITKTRVMYEVQLSFTRVKEYLQYLQQFELVSYDEQNRVFRTTMKEEKLLKLYNEMTDLTSEELLRSSLIRCSDVGVDCDCIIFGINEKKVTDSTITHMYEYHAVNPEEMTACMRLKIKENIQLYRDSVCAQILHEFSDISEKLLPVV